MRLYLALFWLFYFTLFIDIDECLEGLHNCFNGTEICINTIGSFECQCITGYMKDNGVCNGM